MPQIPQISYDSSVSKLEKQYKEAYKNILEHLYELSHVSVQDDIFNRQASLLRQIEVILAGLRESNRLWCEEEIRQAFTNGQAIAILSAGAASSLAEATQGITFSLLSQHTVDSAIADTYEDLLSATNFTEKRIKQMVRQVVGDVMRQRTIQQYGRVTIKKDIEKQLTKKFIAEKAKNEAFIGIIDKAGRRWTPSRYADMIARTKLNQTHVQGVRVEGIQRGIDTAVISTHGATDACSKYEGMIISLNGLTDGLISYEALRATNEIFHPNCQHKVHLVKLDLLPEKVKQKHEEKMKALTNTHLKKGVKALDKIKVPDKKTVQNFSEQLTLEF